MNILEALDDEHLFAPHFTGESWSAWKGFLAALFALSAPEWHRRGLWRLHRPRNAAWCAIHGSGSYRQARRQIPHLGFSLCISCRLPRLCPAPCRWRACDDCGARGEPVTGAEHLSICVGHFESRSAVRADDRGREYRGDHAVQQSRHRNRDCLVSHELVDTPSRRCCATKLPFGSRTKRQPTRMLKSFVRCVRAWLPFRAACCCWQAPHTPSVASFMRPTAGISAKTMRACLFGKPTPRR